MIISEILTYKELFNKSSNRRKERSKNVHYKIPPDFASEEDDKSYTFSTKSTGDQYLSRILFFKPKSNKIPLEDCKVKVDCSCPDYKYTWAYANRKKGSGDVGLSTLNKSLNRPPVINNPRQRVGLCKHLIALGDYIDGELYGSAGQDVQSKLKALSDRNKKPLSKLPGADKRRSELNKLKSIREEIDEIKEELISENKGVVLLDLVDWKVDK